jgi:hypothetical protein
MKAMLISKGFAGDEEESASTSNPGQRPSLCTKSKMQIPTNRATATAATRWPKELPGNRMTLPVFV